MSSLLDQKGAQHLMLDKLLVDKNRTSHYDYDLAIQVLIIMCMLIAQSRSTISSVTPCPLTSMATICYASITTIVGKSVDLELLVLRNN